MLKRLFGLVIILVALLGAAIGGGLFIYGGETLDNVSREVVNLIDLTDRTLDNTRDGLVTTQASLADVNNSLDTVEATTRNLSRTISDTEPLINELNTLLTQEVPNSLDAVQQTLPNLISVAGTIDNTLETLSTFGFEQSFFGIPLAFDLGIEYDPEARFDESVAELGESIETIPGQLRALEGDLTTTADNLDDLSGNLSTLADDLGTINETITEFDTVLGGYIVIIDDAKAELARLEASLPAQLEMLKTALLIVAVYVGLTQLAPLYLGLELLLGKRNAPAAPVPSTSSSTDTAPVVTLDPEPIEPVEKSPEN